MARLAQKDEQLINRYLNEVNSLAPSLRQELAKRILNSLQQNPASSDSPKSLLDFAGVWKGDSDAEKLAENIQNSRYTRPKSELEDWE